MFNSYIGQRFLSGKSFELYINADAVQGKLRNYKLKFRFYPSLTLSDRMILGVDIENFKIYSECF